MDPVLPAEMDEKDAKERRSIQFSVPSAVPTQLDPRQVEMIRRRRPTPATLFRLTDNPSPEEDNASHQWVVGEHSVLKAMRVNTSVYQPPSLKAVQRMAQLHMQSLGTCGPVEREDFHSSGEEESESEESQEISPASSSNQGAVQTLGYDSQEDTKLVGGRPEMLTGSKVNSKGRPDHFIRPLQPRDPHGDEAEEEEDKREWRGE